MLRVDKVFRTERAMRADISTTLEIFKSLDKPFSFNRATQVMETEKERIAFYTAPTLDQAYLRAGQVVDRVDILEPLPASVCRYLNARIRSYASV